jgi:hypothetical protein
MAFVMLPLFPVGILRDQSAVVAVNEILAGFLISIDFQNRKPILLGNR